MTVLCIGLVFITCGLLGALMGLYEAHRVMESEEWDIQSTK